MYAKYCGVPKQEIDVCPTVGWIRDFADPLTRAVRAVLRAGDRPDQQLQLGPGQRSADQRGDGEGGAVVDPTARAQAWANVDKMLVEQAVAIPEDFDNQANIYSKNVAGVNHSGTSGALDLTSPR